MKNTITFILIFLSNSIMFSQCETTNLVRDPSFELDAMFISPDAPYVCESTPEYSCAWQLNDGGGIQNTDNNFDGDYIWRTANGSVYQTLELLPNTDYTFSCWVRIEPEFFTSIFVRIGPDSQTWTEEIIDWKKISFSFTTGTDNLTRTLEIIGSFFVFIDFVELCESTTLSTENNAFQNNISIYPNPNKGIVNISFNKLERNEEVQIKVFNTTGQLVFHKNNIKQDNYQFYLNQSSGLYFIEINTKNENKYFKLIKE